MLHCKLLRSPHPHALIESIDVARAEKLSGRAPGAHRQGFPGALRHHAGVAGRVSARTGARALCRRSGGRGHRRWTSRPRPRRSGLIEVKYKPLPTIADAGGSAGAARSRASTTTASRATSTATSPTSSATWTRRWRRSDHVFEDLFFYEGNTHLPMEQQATLAAVEGDGKLLLWLEHAESALPAPAAGARAADVGRAHPRHRRAQRRRLRRQVRSGQPRNGGVQGGADARAAR